MSYFFRLRRFRNGPSEQSNPLPTNVTQQVSIPQQPVATNPYSQFTDYARALVMQTGQFRVEQLFVNIGSDESPAVSRSTTPTPR